MSYPSQGRSRWIDLRLAEEHTGWHEFIQHKRENASGEHGLLCFTELLIRGHKYQADAPMYERTSAAVADFDDISGLLHTPAKYALMTSAGSADSDDISGILLSMHVR